MRQALVSWPPSGNKDPRATAQLPSGGPANKGLPLDDGISGYKTFAKPEDDIRTPEHEDESIYRIDGPDDIGKSQDRIDVNDQSRSGPSYFGVGERDPGDYGKTHYPHRDGKPNTHNAAAHNALEADPEFIAQWHILAFKVPVAFTYQARTTARVAATAEHILKGLNPKFVDRSRRVSVDLKRADLKNLRWLFRVKGSHVYAVKIRAMRPRKNTTKFSKMDLEISCSCPAWQWQGPEFHATGKDYQLGALMGTASTPDIRDPERKNFVCKHVAAVLDATKAWDIPSTARKTK